MPMALNRVHRRLGALLWCGALAILSCSPDERRVTEPVPFEEIIDDLISRAVQPDDPGMVVLAIRDGVAILERAYGLASLETGSPATTDTRFYLASVSKQFTAMAVMILKERGQLEFDDPIRDIFPEGPAEWDGITIHHLLTHQSGIIDYFAGLDYDFPALNGFTNQDVLDFVVTQNLEFTPGSQYKYSNSGYVLLALLVERVSALPFHTFVRENIFAPLGMDQSVVYDESRPEVPRRAIGYTHDGQLNDYFLLTMGDGGIFSTTEDLMLWDQALYTERLVSPGTLARAFTSYNKRGYGYGWLVRTRQGSQYLLHAGGLAGYASFIGRLPDESFTLVILSSGSYFEEISYFIRRILDLYL
jgi:CubicO group peptidase (beta-lactamase class C family)